MIVAGVLSRIGTEPDPRLAPKRDRAERLQAKARLGLEVQDASERARARFRRFIELRDDAFFLDMSGFRDALGHSIEATRRAARDALQVFGESGSGDEWVLAALPAALSDEQRDEVKRDFFQLLLVLADAVSELPGAPPAQRAQEALRYRQSGPGIAFRVRRKPIGCDGRIFWKGTEISRRPRENGPKPSGSPRPMPLSSSCSDAGR